MTDTRDDTILTLMGEKVALGPFRREFLPLYHRWANDLSVTHTQRHTLRPATMEATERWYDMVSNGGPGVVDFLVYEKATMRPIGYATLDAVDYFNGTATYGILIGEKDCWGQGYGTETTRLMLAYAFNVLGLHNINLTVVSMNERGIRAYARAGFRESGRRREAWRLGQERYDIISMECLASEFSGPSLDQLTRHGRSTKG